MIRNSKKKLRSWATLVFLVIAVSSFSNGYKKIEDFSLPVYSTQGEDIGSDTTTTVREVQLIFYHAIFYSHPNSSVVVSFHCWKLFFADVVWGGFAVCCLILINQRQFLRKIANFLRFLPYFLLQLQILHKFDGKYRIA